MDEEEGEPGIPGVLVSHRALAGLGADDVGSNNVYGVLSRGGPKGSEVERGGRSRQQAMRLEVEAGAVHDLARLDVAEVVAALQSAAGGADKLFGPGTGGGQQHDAGGPPPP